MPNPHRLRGRRVALRMLGLAASLAFVPWAHVYAQSSWAIAITNPADGATIHDNEGNVPVEVTVKRGGTIVALLDGKPYGAPRSSTSFILEGVERGEHTLQVQLVDAGGKVLASSAPVQFYVWRASVLFPGRKQ